MIWRMVALLPPLHSPLQSTTCCRCRWEVCKNLTLIVMQSNCVFPRDISCIQHTCCQGPRYIQTCAMAKLLIFYVMGGVNHKRNGRDCVISRSDGQDASRCHPGPGECRAAEGTKPLFASDQLHSWRQNKHGRSSRNRYRLEPSDWLMVDGLILASNPKGLLDYQYYSSITKTAIYRSL